jgi:transposase
LGVEPWAYLRDVLERLPSHPAGPLAELLPDEWQRRQPAPAAARAPESTCEAVRPASH